MRHDNVRSSPPADRQTARQPRTPPRPRSIVLVFLFLVAANVFDVAATIEVIRRGADEWNPLMQYALSVGPWYFFFLKFTVITGGAAFLAVYARKMRLAWWGLCAMAGVYFLLALLHLFLLNLPVVASLFR